MNPVGVANIGLWTPGFADASSWFENVHDESVTVPPTHLVNRRHLRFASLLTKMAVSTFEQAVAGWPGDLSELNAIFASSQGEIQIAIELLRKIADEGGASPARFMNSVHNTAAGHISIATQGHNYFCALGGGPQTLSAAVTEAVCLLQDSQYENVVVIVGDESSPAPIDESLYAPLAASLLLRSKARPTDLASLGKLVRDPSVVPFAAAEDLAQNPCAPVLGLLRAILSRQYGSIRLDGPASEGWCIDLMPAAS